MDKVKDSSVDKKARTSALLETEKEFLDKENEMHTR